MLFIHKEQHIDKYVFAAKDIQDPLEIAHVSHKLYFCV